MRTPALKQPANRESVKAYVAQVGSYAVEQFRKGSDDRAVIADLRQAGSVYSIRFRVETEYLKFLGVSDQQRMYLRMGASVFAMLVYVGIAFLVHSPDPLLRVALPLLIAVVCGLAAERAVLSQWKKRGRKARTSSD